VRIGGARGDVEADVVGRQDLGVFDDDVEQTIAKGEGRELREAELDLVDAVRYAVEAIGVGSTRCVW
jgi:hypothetical protein